MRRYFFGFIVTLTFVFTTAIGLIRAQPYTSGQLEAFLNPPAGCPVPCFMGVRPRQTTIEQALAILRANEAVKQVQVENNFTGQTIYWRWESDPAAFRHYGFVVDYNLVTRPILPVDIMLGEVQLALGEPEVVTAAYTNEAVQRAAFVFEYPSRGLHILVGFYPCTLDQESFWRLRPQSGLYSNFFIGPGDANYARLLPETTREIDSGSWAKQIRDFCRGASS